MAENIRTTPLRIRPSEYRFLLVMGDLLMAVASVLAALYTWGQYNLYVFEILIDQYTAQGLGPSRARELAEGQTIFEIPFWFYLLPLIWILLLVELYDPHVASSGRRTTRGIAIAAFIGLLAYSVAFIIQQESNLPRIGVGAFLLYGSLLTLLWRMIFIRLYKTTGQRRRVLMIGAHPDDEDTELLTVLVRGMGAEAAYLSLNRGEGGQNLIGPELGEAHRIDELLRREADAQRLILAGKVREPAEQRAIGRQLPHRGGVEVVDGRVGGRRVF